ncbi:shikimate kinase [Clostridium sp.]|uniref:shikimate kinase n=1 Tax=Clostridium sp. TaxID=1506 RepID=UPI003216A34B
MKLLNNIILIGMPGCGKTSFGKELSEDQGLNFIDLDEYLVEKNGMTIEEMFENGEEFFRDRESEAVKDMVSVKNTIIATGGGVVKRKKNIDILKSCGYLVFIHRKPEKIIESVDTSTRPLLKDGKEKIYSLYNERYDLYKEYADVTLDNNGTKEDVIKKLMEILKDLYI